MNAFTAMLIGLAAGVGLAVATWLRSLSRHDVSIIDSVWPWLIWLPATVVLLLSPASGVRGVLVLALAGVWALRLSVHIMWRHRGQAEDHRYQVIRKRNEPHFEAKSLYLVFGLQAALGWLVSLPLMSAVARPAPWHFLDSIGVAVFAFGLLFEAVADAQLARFKADSTRKGQVMDRGLWRYSRHPNYFGECCVWWGLWLIAAATGAWWTVISPVLMTVLLLKVSGVALLESTIVERRPDYAAYIRRTSAFFPRPPHKPPKQ